MNRKLVSLVADTRRMLALAWRIDARLTLLYYTSALFAALAPLGAGITLGVLIDKVVVTSSTQLTVPLIVVIVVAVHFAIVAINAAVRFGLHEQYYDYLFRYRLQDWFSYRYCEKLTELDVPHLEDLQVLTLITKVRSTHQWRVPDFFRMLAYAMLAVVSLIASAIALAPYGAWVVPVVVAATIPRVYLRMRFGECSGLVNAGAPEARKLCTSAGCCPSRRICASSRCSATRGSSTGIARSSAHLRARRRPLDRYRRVIVIAARRRRGRVRGVWGLPDVMAALSVGTRAFFVTMLQQLATQAADAGQGNGAWRIFCAPLERADGARRSS